MQRLRYESQRTTGELRTGAADARSAELVVGEVALEAYRLDRADLDLILATAPPRMPSAAPAASAQSA